MRTIIPVILSGGTGSRLWPLSREAYPKQLLPLLGPSTLLQETIQRVADRSRFGRAMIVANAEHRFVIAEQVREIGYGDARIVLEPVGRNTCPAAAIAALLATKEDPTSLILLMPADHAVADVSAFLDAVDEGRRAAEGGAFVLFGINPTQPATGYGYIRRGAIGEHAAAARVLAFVEKPDLATAGAFVASGEYVWNSGIFLLPAREFLDELQRLEPGMLQACSEAVEKATSDLDFFRLDTEAFRQVPDVSIDYAVMEKTPGAVVISVDCGWSDIGTWSALAEIAETDEHGTSALGDVRTIDTRNSYIRSEGPLVGTVGVDNLIVVATSDAVLVASKDSGQDVRKLVSRLKAEGHPSILRSSRVHRPWGFYQTLHTGDRFQVKRLTVAPGQKLSLQKHFHRSEHWVVVNGTALVTRDDEVILLRENESIYLPLGSVHRLENPGRVPLNIIEVQSGAYLEEDDIVRVEDVYERP
jgi:mannose-1-phosphate guanylyltransferase/mannose-1-phosphate guanylyltransferase/mannose-6-phosphate isomerase